MHKLAQTLEQLPRLEVTLTPLTKSPLNIIGGVRGRVSRGPAYNYFRLMACYLIPQIKQSALV